MIGCCHPAAMSSASEGVSWRAWQVKNGSQPYEMILAGCRPAAMTCWSSRAFVVRPRSGSGSTRPHSPAAGVGSKPSTFTHSSTPSGTSRAAAST
ncbi:hypothetical protein GCM10020001_064360 [Nonomuraea salmonea]